VAIHELRKRDLIGPFADDILYAGVIAINTARSPALTDLAGKGISAGAGVAAGLVGGVSAVAAGAVAKRAGTAVLTKVGGKTVGVALLPVGIATNLAIKDLQRKGYSVSRPSGLGGREEYKT